MRERGRETEGEIEGVERKRNWETEKGMEGEGRGEGERGDGGERQRDGRGG